MSSGEAARGVARLRETLPARFGDCRVRLRTDRADHAPSDGCVVEFAVPTARTTLVLAAGETAPPALDDARRATLADTGAGGELYGVVTGETLTVRRIRRATDPSSDRAVATVPLARLRSLLALVAWRVRAETRALYARFDALRRAVEPLARARLDHGLDDAEFADRLRDSLRAAGPAADDLAFDADERATVAAQASCLFVDALVAVAPDPSLAETAVPDAPPESAWAAIVDRIREDAAGPLFDPGETPLVEVALRPPPGSGTADAAAAAVDAVAETVRTLDRSSLSVDESTFARLFERLLPVDRRRRWGQVYTPPAVARLLADWTVDGDATTVLDPACGTGRLLRAVVDSRRDGGRPPPAVYGRDVFALPVALTARSLPPDVAADVAARDFFTCVPVPDAAGADTGASTLGEPSVPFAAADGNAAPDSAGGPAAADADRLPLVDAVIANPPYTRREALDDDYVEFVRGAVADGSAVDRRAGLAPYFLRHAASFLREGGRMGVVVGSSWLDAAYGADLRSFLLDTFRIRGVVSAPRHHLVDTAEVNAVLLLLERTTDAADRDDTPVSFVRLHGAPGALSDGDSGRSPDTDTERPGAGVLARSLVGPADEHVGEGSHPRRLDGDATVVRRRQGTLRGSDGSDGPNGKWGRYVRAPRAYWAVLDACGDRFVDFHDLAAAGWARLAYGTRSGAPDFFYLPNAHHDVAVDGDTLRVVPRDGTGLDGPRRLPRRYWMHRPADLDGARDVTLTDPPTTARGPGAPAAAHPGDTHATPADGWRPNYLLKRTRGIDSLRFDVADLDLGAGLKYVLRLPDPRAELDPAARAYVEWGESHDVVACPHCRRAKPFPAYCHGERWYDLTGRLTRGALLPNKDVHATHAYWTPTAPLWVHQSLYGIDAADPPLLAALTNSTLGLLMLEVAGRVNLGEGALDLMTDDHRSVQVPDPRTIDGRTRDALVNRFEGVASRSIGTVFEECGARRRDAVSLDAVRPDRRALDETVMGEVLGLSADVQERVYRGLVGLVDDRLTKARRGG
jgi:SAM-dependent methyltransferase